MGKISQYEVRLASLSGGKYEQDFECGITLFRSMDNNEVSAADVHVHLTVERLEEVYILTFGCRGTLQVPCDRCLDDMDIPVDTDYTMKVRYGAEYDDSQDDLLILPENQTVLDTASIIYTTLMLCIPLHRTHGEGECNPEMLSRLREHSEGSAEEWDETQPRLTSR